METDTTSRTHAAPRPFALFRLFVGLHDRHGRPVDPGALADATAFLDHAHDSYTRTDARGVWQGSQEPTALFDIVQPDTDEAREQARATARTLARILDQECVALAIQPLHAFELHAGSAAPAPRLCAECGEQWPCSDSKRTDIRPTLRAAHRARTQGEG